MRKVKSLNKIRSISTPKKRVQSLSYYKQKSPLSSPIFTPSIHFSKIYSPNWQQNETIEDKMKDPNWIPFWRRPKDLKARQKSWIPTSLYDKYYETHKEPFTKSSIYYQMIAQGLIDFLVDTKYSNVENYEITYGIDEEEKYFTFIKEKHHKYTIHDIIIKSCSNPKKDITLISLKYKYVSKNGESGGHSQILIINHIYKTIEFYDPQYHEGIDVQLLEYKITDILKKNNIKYTYKNIEETCPKLNFQDFENLNFIPQPIRAEGFCLLWSAFLAQVRITYARYSTRTIQRMLGRLVREMKIHLEFVKNKKINPFAKFIYNYALYWEKNMSKTFKLKSMKKYYSITRNKRQVQLYDDLKY